MVLLQISEPEHEEESKSKNTPLSFVKNQLIDNAANNKLVVGIDLGTTNSLAAFVKRMPTSSVRQSIDEPELISRLSPDACKVTATTPALSTSSNIQEQVKIIGNSKYQQLVPSVVYYGADQEVLVGHNALAKKYTNNITNNATKHVNTSTNSAAKINNVSDGNNVISSVKRLIGRGYADVIHDSYPHTCQLIQVTPQNELDTDLAIETPQGNKTAIEISSEILKHLKTCIYNELQTLPTAAVITVPAYFTERERQATKKAATDAGLTVLRLLNEPTAAAIAYGLNKDNDSNNKTFLVYDLGGGTFDVSILVFAQGVFEVLAVGGDTLLGGNDFDVVIYNELLTKVRAIENELADWLVMHHKDELLNIAKHSKEELTNAASVSLTSSTFFEILDTLPVHLQTMLTQQKLNDLKQLTLSASDFATLSAPLIDRTMRAVRKALVDADLEIDNIDEFILVGGATRMPIIKEAIGKYYQQRPPLDYIDPDLVVAIGAALQADLLSGASSKEWLLLDVTPLSLGIETLGGITQVIIPRNTVIPITMASDFTTYHDNQESIAINIVQGEHEEVSKCRSIGRFILSGIPPLKASEAKIRVIFNIDVDGLLTVSAIEQSSNIKHEITIKPTFGLDMNNIDLLLKSG